MINITYLPSAQEMPPREPLNVRVRQEYMEKVEKELEQPVYTIAQIEKATNKALDIKHHYNQYRDKLKSWDLLTYTHTLKTRFGKGYTMAFSTSMWAGQIPKALVKDSDVDIYMARLLEEEKKPKSERPKLARKFRRILKNTPDVTGQGR